MTFEKLLKEWNGGILRGAQVRLAEELHISHPTVSGWLAGRSFPSEEQRPKLARLLRIPVAQLMSAFAETKRQKQIASGIGISPVNLHGHTPALIGVVGIVSAESFSCAFEAPPEEFLPVFVPPGYKPEQIFALKISGQCMEPTAKDGEIAVIARVTEFADGQLCVVRVDGECTFKRAYRRGTDCVELKPDNPAFKPLRVAAKHAEILGRVLFFYRKP